MKKLCMGIAASLLVSAICVGFAACGENTIGEVDIQTAEKIMGAEVTAEQWAEALSYFYKDDAVYTLTCTQKQEYIVTDVVDPSISAEEISGSVVYAATIKIDKDGRKQSARDMIALKGDEKVKEFLEHNNIHGGFPVGEMGVKSRPIRYYERIEEGTDSGGVYYEQNEDGRWERSPDDLPIMFGFIGDLLKGIDAMQYEAFEYDDEKKVYRMDEYNLKFNTDGQLAAFYYTLDRSSELTPWCTEYTTRTTVFSYKGVKVTLPAVEA